jgi:hypothetical protein
MMSFLFSQVAVCGLHVVEFCSCTWRNVVIRCWTHQSTTHVAKGWLHVDMKFLRTRRVFEDLTLRCSCIPRTVKKVRHIGPRRAPPCFVVQRSAKRRRELVKCLRRTWRDKGLPDLPRCLRLCESSPVRGSGLLCS